MNENAIKQAVTVYLDSMPSCSRVTYPDLIGVVSAATGFYSPMLVSRWVHEVVRTRSDFMVIRRKGICKYSKP